MQLVLRHIHSHLISPGQYWHEQITHLFNSHLLCASIVCLLIVVECCCGNIKRPVARRVAPAQFWMAPMGDVASGAPLPSESQQRDPQVLETPWLGLRQVEVGWQIGPPQQASFSLSSRLRPAVFHQRKKSWPHKWSLFMWPIRTCDTRSAPLIDIW